MVVRRHLVDAARGCGLFLACSAVVLALGVFSCSVFWAVRNESEPPPGKLRLQRRKQQNPRSVFFGLEWAMLPRLFPPRAPLSFSLVALVFVLPPTSPSGVLWSCRLPVARYHRRLLWAAAAAAPTQASVIEALASAEWDAEQAAKPAVDESKDMEVVMGGSWS